MGKGAGRTLEEMQNQILGSFQSISRKSGKSREDDFEKLPLKERIRIADERAAADRERERQQRADAREGKNDIRETWWSLGQEIRERKLKEERAKLL